jgi:pSer/pThr/pTyr-binding forkhead associated (FHA) protein
MDVGLVCDQCSAFNAMGVHRCVRCGADVSLDDTTEAFDSTTNVGPGPIRTPAPDSRPPPRNTNRQRPLEMPPAQIDNPCPICGAQVIPGHRFCGECGSRMPEAGTPRHAAPAGSGPARPSQSGPVDKSIARRTLYFGAIQAARAKLTVIRGDGLDGVSFNLAGEEHQAGRVDCPLLFPDDPFLSPLHCNFFYRTGELVVKDEDSVNGVYVRISGSRPIPFGARFLVGEQLLEVEKGDVADEAVEDGTYFFASPRRPSHVRVVQRLRGGESGLAFRATSDAVTIGREGNDINFPDDPFISGHHARIAWDGQSLILTDLGSKNGTFLRVVGEQTLGHGDYVFMGQQLLRVEVV